ncbi:MAG: Asp-tRNA(Asn)/Glu-tRNA(Gln) amidotransferase subunit GatC [Bdellovibrionaceae bacterium]|nr:Asp-tRNA(Asn)/Glu-tRNA(Gln) amidotransferase subunit GatC [Pseudobdellovibrionaceae bacterium]
MAHLSRLELSEAESNQLGKDLGKVLNFFNQIAEVNTTGVEPMVTPVEIENYLREDEKNNEITTEEIMANAPSRAGNLFKVPPVV